MSSNSGYLRTVEEVEYLIAKRRINVLERPRLIVSYIQCQSGTRSLHGEIIEQILIEVGARKIPIPLSLRALAILDLLIRKRQQLLTAAQIEYLLKTDSFSMRLAAHLLSRRKADISIDRRTIKVYIKRIRARVEKSLREIGCASGVILASEPTDLETVMAYRLVIPCHIVHYESSEESEQRLIRQ